MHHSNIIISRSDCRSFVFKLLAADLAFKVEANPDFLLIEKESFGIDDARDLEVWTIGKPLSGDIKVSFMITKSITREAQNALLKVLEEPPLGTYFFINLENLGAVLPTLLSRVRVLNLSEEVGGFEDKTYNFLKSDIKERLSIIRTLSKKEDKGSMKELIKNLEEIAYKKNAASLNHILTAKIFASTRGGSPKMLLEWLSAVL